MENVVNMYEYPNFKEWWPFPNSDGTGVYEPQVTITINCSSWIQCPKCRAWIWTGCSYDFCPYCGADLNAECCPCCGKEIDS